MCECYSGSGHQPGRSGVGRPKPAGVGKRNCCFAGAGVAVTEGVLREECDALNRIFFHFITTKRPFVSMKYAMTMDGKIATVTGASKWITSEAARADVQQQRHRFSGIMVGVGTILADDPLLTCHMENGKIQFASSAILSCGHHCKHRWSQQQNRSRPSLRPAAPTRNGRRYIDRLGAE